MSYSILITGQTNEANVSHQVLIIEHNGKRIAYSRNTNGGRGESNAWFETDYNELNSQCDYPIIGEILSSPLTDVDVSAIENGERPVVLIQKLTKQYSTRHKDVDTTRTLGDVIQEAKSYIEVDSTQLEKYRADGRKDKTQVQTQSLPKPKNPIAPVIKVVYDNNESSVHKLATIHSMSNPELANYIERSFGGKTETEIYDYAIANRQSVALVGEAGTGKTTSTMRYSAYRGLYYYRVNFNAGIEASTLFGKLLPTEANNLVWQDGGFTECWRTGNAVIHLDELSFIVAKQSGVLFPTLDNTKTLTLLDHKGEVIPAGDNLLIVGSYNDSYYGNNKLNQAFIDRFHHKLRFEYDINIERNFIKSETLLKLAEQMRAEAIAGVYETPISTRLLKNFQEFSYNLGYEYAVDNFINNFTEEERPSVKLLLEAHRHNLELELV